jgi:hypothetical protein
MRYRGAFQRHSGTFPYRSPSEATPEEKQFLNELGGDIVKHRPKLVFIDATDPCQACPKGFQVAEYLAAAGWLQKFVGNYRLTGYLKRFAMYCRAD